MKIEFQLHHTGIKTYEKKARHMDTPDFNCTIQELKLTGLFLKGEKENNFNCTIQELKRKQLAD